MGYSKRQFVSAAFEEIGLAAYAYDLQPDQLQSALRRLDAMMAEWNGRGVRLSYPFSDSPQCADLDEQTQVPDFANEAIITGLAVRIAPGYGKQVMPDTRIAAKRAYDLVLTHFTRPIEVQLPSTIPSGAGNKAWTVTNRPFLAPSKPNLTAGAGDALEIPDTVDTIGMLTPGSYLGMRPIIQNTTVVVRAELTWTDYSTRWDSPPVEAGTSTHPVAGTVYSYTLDGVTRYRLVPAMYDANEDAFYTTYVGTTCSDIIVRRSDG